MERRKIMLIGVDPHHVQERRFRAAGYEVVCAPNRESGLDFARHHRLDGAVILSHGSLLNVAEIIFNLRDLCSAIKIIILLPYGAKTTGRFVRQLLNHPIQGSEIMTRRQLQKQLPYSRHFR
jgi:ActR/RegA family two-component response regulator